MMELFYMSSLMYPDYDGDYTKPQMMLTPMELKVMTVV